MTLSQLLNETIRDHYANRGATECELVTLEKRLHYRLPLDMRMFYSACNGVRFFNENDPPYRFLPLDEIDRARIKLSGYDDNEYGPESWIAFCDVRDSNYVGIELSTEGERPYAILDLFHESELNYSESTVIANSFYDFLKRVLGSGGEPLFWLDELI